MIYQEKPLPLTNPLDFWHSFAESDERVLWADRLTRRTIVACERLSTVKETEIGDYPYAFYSRHFFDSLKGPLWQDFGNELIAFKHYLVMDDNGSHYYFAEKHRDIEHHMIERFDHQLSEQPTDRTDWQHLFDHCQAPILRGELEKVVASREVIFETEGTFHIESILENLLAQNPTSIVFAYQKGRRVFLGATPEILVQKQNQRIKSFALAGTISRTAPHAAEKLLANQKNTGEQAIVVRKIQEKMQSLAGTVTVSERQALPLRNVYHLQNTLTAIDDKHSIFEWARLLHPTPALGGEPSETALQLLRQEEKHERGLYAAPIGMIDSSGSGTIAVGIRSALIEGRRLYAYAGCGIVAESDANAEFAETQLKLKTILEAL